MAVVIDGQEFYTAEEVCATLGVKPSTLDAYVSRGLL
jgi:DNA-binding transcriptional MerR regulator